MTEDRRVLWAIVGTVGLLLAVILLSDRVQEELRPEPLRAFVAIEVGDEGVARPGRVELPAGIGFRLHAVLEAETLGGRRVYFTEAPGLEIDGEMVPAESLRGWGGPEEVKVLWFSIEGPRPFVELEDGQALSGLAFQANFRPDWPRAWSIPGSIRPAREAALGGELAPERRVHFGTQRFQVRLELFGLASELVPKATFESLAAKQVGEEAQRFPTVVAPLAGKLALPSRVFGLTQIGASGAALEHQATRLKEWFDKDLAFSRLLLLRGMLDRAGIAWDDLVWHPVELAAGPAWGPESIGRGDLLKAGERVVVLYEDRGVAGRLDYEDLCMDFFEGAQVSPLKEVFTGEGLVEWTALAAN